MVRAPLIARLLLAQPYTVHEVEIVPLDLSRFVLWDGSPPEQWQGDEMANAEVAELTARERVTGPFLCAAKTTDGTLGGAVDPIVLIDGTHRLAAWRKHIASGRSYSVDGYWIGCRSAPRLAPD
jgi:hypothetical protein